MNRQNYLKQSLTLAALALSATQLTAHTNKTFLPTQSINRNLAADTIVFSELTTPKKAHAFGGTFQTTAFYSKSDNGRELGSYFGIKNKNEFTAYNNLDADLDLGTVIYDAGATRTTPNIIHLQPTQTIYGLRFHYNQNLSNLLDGLYVRATLPVVRVENDFGFAVTNASSASNQCDVVNYFNGSLAPIAVDNTDARVALTNGLIAGTQVATNVADIDLALGYTFLKNHKYHLAANIGLTIPTGTKAKGIYAFEPLTGNGGHYELGAGLEYATRLIGDDHNNVTFNAALDYRYALEAGEMRTFGIKGVNLGHYQLLTDVQAGNGLDTIVTTPAANVLTLKTNITPGNSFQALAGISCKTGNFFYETGYNIRYQEKGSAVITDKWDDDQYGRILTKDLDLTGLYGAPNLASSNITPLPKSMIDLSSVLAETMSHKLYSNLGYTFSKMENPVYVAIGGHYEIANSNALTSNWGLNVKTSLSF